MRVTKQPEPVLPDFDFDQEVRQPGLSAIAELTGKAPSIRRPGPKIKKRVERLEDLPPSVLREYDYWTRALPVLHRRYKEICAYSCFRISKISGPTVDHFVAITSGLLTDAYEWENYRLACSLMNSRKRDFSDVLDPFVVEDWWFTLDLNTLEVNPSPKLQLEDPDLAQKVDDTIKRLGLNNECRVERERFFQLYWDKDVSLGFLETEAPFLVREMKRQGRIRPEDAAPA